MERQAMMLNEARTEKNVDEEWFIGVASEFNRGEFSFEGSEVTCSA